MIEVSLRNKKRTRNVWRSFTSCRGGRGGGSSLFPFDVGGIVLSSARSLRPVKALILVFGLLLTRLQYLERTHECFVDRHHAPGIVELPAVVGRREEGDQLPLGKELVAVLDHLMGSAYEVQVVAVEELADHVSSEGKAHAPIVLTPALNILVRIRPEEITQQPCVGDVCRSHDPSDLLHALQIRAQPAVATEDLFIDYSCNGQTVETVGESFPQFNIIPSFAFVIESVYPVDGCALVVAA